jgi:hypothetical protein
MIIDARRIYAITETAEYDYSNTNYSNYTRIATTSMANQGTRMEDRSEFIRVEKQRESTDPPDFLGDDKKHSVSLIQRPFSTLVDAVHGRLTPNNLECHRLEPILSNKANF